MTSYLLDTLKNRFPGAMLDTHAFRGDETMVIHRENILEVVRFLKEDPELAFEQLTDLTCVDYLGYPDHQGERLHVCPCRCAARRHATSG